MPAPNGQRGADTPSNASSPFASAETVQSKMNRPVSQGAGSGQVNTSSSASPVMGNSMNAGRGQPAGGSNAVPQDRTQPPPGFGRGHGQLPPSRTWSNGPILVPPRTLGRGRGLPKVWGKRDLESTAEAFGEAAMERPLKSPRLSHQHEVSTQTDILDEANSLKPEKPTDDSEDTTSIMIQRNSSRGVEIDLKINPNTEEGREMLLDAARRVGQQNGNVHILVSMRPVMGTDAREKQ